MKIILIFISLIIIICIPAGMRAEEAKPEQEKKPCIVFDKITASQLFNHQQVMTALRAIIEKNGPEVVSGFSKAGAKEVISINKDYISTWENIIAVCNDQEDRALIMKQIENMKFVNETLEKQVLDTHI